MREVINGKVYDTKTAQQVCDITPLGLVNGRRDFTWEDTRLYRTAKGAFFIAGEGGPRSRWAQSV